MEICVPGSSSRVSLPGCSMYASCVWFDFAQLWHLSGWLPAVFVLFAWRVGKAGSVLTCIWVMMMNVMKVGLIRGLKVWIGRHILLGRYFALTGR